MLLANILLTITLGDLHLSVNTIYENCKYLQLLRFTVAGQHTERQQQQTLKLKQTSHKCNKNINNLIRRYHRSSMAVKEIQVLRHSKGEKRIKRMFMWA